MNRLKKKAIQEFVTMCIFMLITLPCFIFFTARNTQGFDYILIWVIIGVPTGLLWYLIESKKLKTLDERQRSLYQRAVHLSYGVFVFYLLGFSVIAFFLVGGGGTVPVWLLPIMLFTGVFLAGTTSSFIIYRQCEREGDELEGEDV